MMKVGAWLDALPEGHGINYQPGLSNKAPMFDNISCPDRAAFTAKVKEFAQSVVARNQSKFSLNTVVLRFKGEKTAHLMRIRAK